MNTDVPMTRDKIRDCDSCSLVEASSEYKLEQNISESIPELASSSNPNSDSTLYVSCVVDFADSQYPVELRPENIHTVELPYYSTDGTEDDVLIPNNEPPETVYYTAIPDPETIQTAIEKEESTVSVCSHTTGDIRYHAQTKDEISELQEEIEWYKAVRKVNKGDAPIEICDIFTALAWHPDEATDSRKELASDALAIKSGLIQAWDVLFDISYADVYGNRVQYSSIGPGEVDYRESEHMSTFTMPKQFTYSSLDYAKPLAIELFTELRGDYTHCIECGDVIHISDAYFPEWPYVETVSSLRLCEACLENELPQEQVTAAKNHNAQQFGGQSRLEGSK